jgi:hypothetical protein
LPCHGASKARNTTDAVVQEAAALLGHIQAYQTQLRGAGASSSTVATTAPGASSSIVATTAPPRTAMDDRQTSERRALEWGFAAEYEKFRVRYVPFFLPSFLPFLAPSFLLPSLPSFLDSLPSCVPSLCSFLVFLPSFQASLVVFRPAFLWSFLDIMPSFLPFFLHCFLPS